MNDGLTGLNILIVLPLLMGGHIGLHLETQHQDKRISFLC